MISFLFFLSGISGLVYQVIWVRQFGNVFGNTVYSTSLVVAVFMLGLGTGGYVIGMWADRRYQRAPESLLRAYGAIELAIAALGLSVSLVLPRLAAVAAFFSSYSSGPHGWFVLSPMSYVARGAIAVVLLAPATILMGGTLTLLIRHRVRHDIRTAGWQIAALYSVNTAGAAAGAFLTDFALVPLWGLFAAQMAAVALNAIAGVGALALARASSAGAAIDPDTTRLKAGVASHSRSTSSATRSASAAPRPGRRLSSGKTPAAPGAAAAAEPVVPTGSPAVVWTSIAVALCGFAGLSMEILWVRHFTLLLGGFRAVFSLVMTVILVGIGVGSLVGGAIDRRSDRPAQALMLVEALFIAAMLAGLAGARFGALASTHPALGASPFGRWLTDLWYDLRPILIEAGAASVLMGCSFPLGNAVVQRAESQVGRRAGGLYLANTAGAVAGSLVAGFVLLPAFGLQRSATVVSVATVFAIGALFQTIRVSPSAAASQAPQRARPRTSGLPRTFASLATAPVVLSALVASAALGAWLLLPPDYVLRRSLAPPKPGEQILTLTEGVDETIAITEIPGLGRGLITNGHPMSSTALLDQRYMRTLAHVPLLSMDHPARVLVIGFGVGNSTHAATLHPSVERVEVVDLSRQILEHAAYFRDANAGVLDNPLVSVYLNDGRQHLAMQPPATYDLITLEPPPIAHAGVASLYSREFYALARSRLKAGGYLSQWLPAYQVPDATSLSMVRAFVDVFPQSVLLSGMHAELVLIGTTAQAAAIDPGHVARELERTSPLRADLERLDMGTATQIVGTFVGSADTLARATRGATPVSDNRPLQEYSVRSVIDSEPGGVPASLIDVAGVAAWCPRCFDRGHPATVVGDLGTYLALLDQSYRASGADAASRRGGAGPRRILGSAYLAAVLPDNDAVHNIIGVSLLRSGNYEDAAKAFREALQRDADSADANRNLGVALAGTGQSSEALGYLERAVRTNPDDGDAQYALGSVLLERREFREAAASLREALRTMPASAAAHNDLGVALANLGDLPQAREQFRQAVTLDPGFAEAQRNLESALKAGRPGGS